jgi:hypothetical protein
MREMQRDITLISIRFGRLIKEQYTTARRAATAGIADLKYHASIPIKMIDKDNKIVWECKGTKYSIAYKKLMELAGMV